MTQRWLPAIYETTYGNAAMVNKPDAKSAFDLDLGVRIPISEVTRKYLRAIKAVDRVQRYTTEGSL